MSNLNRYVDMLNYAYYNGTNNHPEHNSNPKYWDILLGDITTSPAKWEGKVALDFGCGKGRNITNLSELANWERLDGIDVSVENINHCKNNPEFCTSNFYKNSGQDLSDLKDNEYDFIMSTIVFQHMCVHELRYKIKQEIFRVLKPGGLFSFQMGYGDIAFTGHTQPTNYFDNNYDAQNTNGSYDVRVTNIDDLLGDLTKIGFTDITYSIEEPWEDGGHPNWVYVKCLK